VFARASLYEYLNSGRHLVAYKADSRIFDVIRTPLRALSAQVSRVQTPTQPIIMEDDEEPIRKVVRKTRFST
jgi:hypothetical protein